MSFLDKFFGPTYEKELKEISPIIKKINAFEAVITDRCLMMNSISVQHSEAQSGTNGRNT